MLSLRKTVQMLFAKGGEDESIHLQTSRQNTEGTLAWKSDSTSENSAAGRREKHLFCCHIKRNTRPKPGKAISVTADKTAQFNTSKVNLQRFFRISRT